MGDLSNGAKLMPITRNSLLSLETLLKQVVEPYKGFYVRQQLDEDDRLIELFVSNEEGSCWQRMWSGYTRLTHLMTTADNITAYGPIGEGIAKVLLDWKPELNVVIEGSKPLTKFFYATPAW